MEQNTLQLLTCEVAITILSWTKNQYPKVLTQQCLENSNFKTTIRIVTRPRLFQMSHLWPFGLDETSTKSQGLGYLAYLDDRLIYSKTEKKHLDMVSNALECLQKASHKIKLSKCSFFKEQIHYLGHLVSANSILPLKDKIETLMKLKPPTNIKEIRHFLSLTGYYRKFIHNYLDIAHPLNCLMRKPQTANLVYAHI